ncbi:MAG: class I SAM-dependent methyltransferase [Proteobacteria bacterium]|nr:class I SAM-dependent methyltransferase [Pseudomonadota bacterium]
MDDVKMISFDRVVRKIFPSVSRLSYNWLFKLIVNQFDLLPRLIFKELRQIPPNHLRIRVGVGNRLFTNQISYYAGARNFWLATALEGFWDLDSTILDIGCGCGRNAQYLRDFRHQTQRFRGRYIGIDIEEEMLNWCRKTMDAERFTFMKSPHSSKSYNVTSGNDENYKIDLPDQSVDFVYSTSLFTHLLDKQLINYIEESFRVLKPGRAMYMSVFSLDCPPPTYGSRHTFSHSVGNARVESLRQPEAAVAYNEDFLVKTSKNVGFTQASVIQSPGDGQIFLLCYK